MNGPKPINQQKFEKLLNWLNSDRELAGQKYELIRQRLIAIFDARNCLIPEDLADETIDRLINKIDEIVNDYKGEPKLCFYGYGKNVLLEYFRKTKTEELSPLIVQNDVEVTEITPTQRCLRTCLKELSAEDRHLILGYYQKDKQEKISRRKNLAEETGADNELLRIRMNRLKKKLQKCIKKCLEEK